MQRLSQLEPVGQAWAKHCKSMALPNSIPLPKPLPRPFPSFQYGRPLPPSNRSQLSRSQPLPMPLSMQASCRSSLHSHHHRALCPAHLLCTFIGTLLPSLEILPHSPRWLSCCSRGFCRRLSITVVRRLLLKFTLLCCSVGPDLASHGLQQLLRACNCLVLVAVLDASILTPSLSLIMSPEVYLLPQSPSGRHFARCASAG